MKAVEDQLHKQLTLRSHGNPSVTNYLSGLVIDDTPLDRMLRAKDFKDAGYSKIDKASGGAQALEMLKEKLAQYEMYTAITCDYEMPEMNGAETVFEIIKLIIAALKKMREEEDVLLDRKEILLQQLHQKAFARKLVDASAMLNELAFFKPEYCMLKLRGKMLMDEEDNLSEGEDEPDAYLETCRMLAKISRVIEACKSIMLICVTTKVQEMRDNLEVLLKAEQVQPGSQNILLWLGELIFIDKDRTKHSNESITEGLGEAERKSSAPMSSARRDSLFEEVRRTRVPRDRIVSEPISGPSYILGPHHK